MYGIVRDSAFDNPDFGDKDKAKMEFVLYVVIAIYYLMLVWRGG